MKIAVVTGASSGIGKAIAIHLVKAGYEVHGTYNSSKTEAEKLNKDHGIIFHKVDLSKRANTLALAKELENLKIYALVNDAGIWEADNIDSLDFDNWDKTLEINLTVPVVLSIALSKSIEKGGSIVNISSTDGMIGSYEGLSYSASKAGLINITKSLGNLLGPKGIRVNSISPGWIDTAMVTDAPAEASKEMTPLGRNGSPEEIASVVEFLVSDKSSYINGENIIVDGGLINTDYSLKVESEA